MHTSRCVLGGPNATQQTRLAQVYPVNYYRIYEIKTTPAGQYYTRKKNITLFNEIFDTYMYFQFNPTVVVVKRRLEYCNENQYEIHYLHRNQQTTRDDNRSHRLGLSEGKISMND